MRKTTIVCGLLAVFAATASANPVHFSTGAPDGKMAMATHPASSATAADENEAADDFILTDPVTDISHFTFTGLVPAGSSASEVAVEIYRVFPANSKNPPSGRVPTRTNSPADDALVVRDSATLELTFKQNTVASSFSALNSVSKGIHAQPNQTTGGEGAVSGTEVSFDVTLAKPIRLEAGHYFFVPQVKLSSGEFFWLSTPKPIGADGTPFTGDLQAWIRNSGLDPDWLRVGSDIVGGATPPTFNGAFAFDGTSSPFSIVPGITGAWFNQNQSGHGFQLEVLPGNLALMYWYTFDAAGNQAWIAGVGQITGNQATVPAVLVQGGRFPPNFDPTKITKPAWGTVTFTFSGCNAAHAEWTSTAAGFGNGGMDLTRLTQVDTLACP